MSAQIIDGKAIAADLRAAVAAETRRLIRAWPRARAWRWCWSATIRPAKPMSAANRAPSSKSACGRSIIICRPTTSEAELLASDRASSTPIPPCTASWCNCRCRRRSIASRIIAAVDPAKDVDGFHPLNAGRLGVGIAGAGAVHADRLHQACQDGACRRSTGLDAVVIGRSNIVGKPLAQLLLAENATVTIAHSRTRDLPACAGRADLLFAAIGRAGIGPRRLDQARRDRHRCRHQPRRRRRRQIAHRRRRLFCRSRRSRRRDHAGAGRRRADDDRLPARQYAARGLPAGGLQRSPMSEE